MSEQCADWLARGEAALRAGDVINSVRIEHEA